MTLGEILRTIRDAPTDATIVAEKPWTQESRASVCEIPTAVLSELEVDGQSYFLEVFIACDLWEDIERAGVDEEGAIVARIIKYAIDDA